MTRPHYDDSVRDPVTGVKSEWTLLIYLSGVEDGVEGGEVSLTVYGISNRVTLFSQTLFYHEERGKPREVIKPTLKRGTALLHR